MADLQELLQAWQFPYVQHHGVTLVARADAAACVERIFAEGYRFYGYDSFTLFRDGKITEKVLRIMRFHDLAFWSLSN